MAGAAPLPEDLSCMKWRSSKLCWSRCAEVAQSGHSGRVVGLHLVIGRLSGVHADSIRFAFELLSPDSIAAGAELAIDRHRAAATATTAPSRWRSMN